MFFDLCPMHDFFVFSIDFRGVPEELGFHPPPLEDLSFCAFNGQKGHFPFPRNSIIPSPPGATEIHPEKKHLNSTLFALVQVKMYFISTRHISMF